MLRTLMSGLFVMLALLMPNLASAVRDMADPADGWDSQFRIWAIISSVIYLVVTIPLVYFVVKYKRRTKDEEGAYIEGNVGLEILWTVIPLVIIVLLGTQSWALFNNYRKPPKDAFEAKVTASMYKYEMISPDGIRSVNELRVPAGHVKLNLTSSDVIHNFAIPAFRVREDMVPGRLTYLWFNAKTPGTYQVYCAEFCGSGHSQMLAKVIVMPKPDYEKWVRENQATQTAGLSPEETGKKLVDSLGCTGCHSVDGEAKLGPTLKGIVGRQVELADGKKLTSDDEYIKVKLKDPKATLVKGFDPMMQPTGMSDTDIAAVTAYLKTLK
ncbi:MAG: cytochrome c oxidase subunit II [Nitrospirae bacterium]|nr:cytochrome c oxidase subunit II [Nitrospirota bacterium]